MTNIFITHYENRYEAQKARIRADKNTFFESKIYFTVGAVVDDIRLGMAGEITCGKEIQSKEHAYKIIEVLSNTLQYPAPWGNELLKDGDK